MRAKQVFLFSLY